MRQNGYILLKNHTWVASSRNSGEVPPNAVHAGYDSDNSPIYVGRGLYEGNKIPAKVIPDHKYASVSYGGAEHSLQNYEVLCGDGYTWVGSSNGHVPEGAVIAGIENDGKPLYVGRGHYMGSLTPGKILQSHECLYIGHSHGEHSIKHYEVLIGGKTKGSNWTASTINSPAPSNALMAGIDSDNSPIFVGRASHGGDIVPAKIIPSKKAAYISYAGKEILISKYEYLCNVKTHWILSRDGNVPSNAVKGGKTSMDETLYIGRVHHGGALTPGKVHPSHGCIYLSFGGQELSFRQYEILVEN